MNTYILVVTNFTEGATATLGYALAIAKRRRCGIFLLHQFLLDIPPGSNQHLFDKQLEEMTQRGEEGMQKLLATIEPAYQSQIQTLVRRGHLESVLKEVIQSHSIDMVAFHIEGHKSWESFFLKESTFLEEHIPVLAIPSEVSMPPEVDRIVYATKLDEQDYELLKEIIAFANLFNARLDCLHISTDAKKLLSENAKMADLQATFANEALLESRLNFKVVLEKEFKSGLENYLLKNKSDLLIMKREETNFLKRIFSRRMQLSEISVDTHVPLLLYRR
jgi:hypothetical protein